jgi:hypothetical protein
MLMRLYLLSLTNGRKGLKSQPKRNHRIAVNVSEYGSFLLMFMALHRAVSTTDPVIRQDTPQTLMEELILLF